MKRLIILLFLFQSAYAQMPFVNNVDVDARAFVVAAGITDGPQIGAVNQLVKDLKGYSLWSKMKAVYPMIGGTSTTNKYNLKDPRDLDAAYRLSFIGSPTFSTNGVDWNGTTQYANTFLAPNVMSQNSFHMSYYSRDNVNEGSIAMGSYYTVGNVGADLELYLSTLYSYTNNASGDYATVALATTKAFFITTRTASTTAVTYSNGSSIATNSTTSKTPSAVTIFLAASNYDATPLYFCTYQCAFASIGDGLSSTDAANLYTIVTKFQTTLGRQN